MGQFPTPGQHAYGRPPGGSANLLRTCVVVSIGLVSVSLLVGCSQQPASPEAPKATSTAAATATPDPSAPRMSKVLVIMLENHDHASAMSQMPVLAGLGRRYGLFTQYFGVARPSLPNYLTIVGGSISEVRNNKSPAANPISGSSVFGQALANGGSARTYAEGMTENCQLSDTGRYAVKHNPWPYYVDERKACASDNVPSGTTTGGALASDIRSGELPTIGMFVPDLCNDGHDCPLSHVDDYLKEWLEAITAGPDFASGRLSVLVTFDEDDHESKNHISAVLAHKDLESKVVDQRFDHVDLSASLSALAGGQPLREAATGENMFIAMGLAPAAGPR